MQDLTNLNHKKNFQTLFDANNVDDAGPLLIDFSEIFQQEDQRDQEQYIMTHYK
jgi:hypothetical protein